MDIRKAQSFPFSSQVCNNLKHEMNEACAMRIFKSCLICSYSLTMLQT